MPRVRRGTKRAHKRRRTLKFAKGFYGTRHNAYRIAKQAVDRALAFAYRDRRQKKRQFRRLWIARINAAARQHGLSYSRFMNGLKRAECEVDRKMLSGLAIHEPKAFEALAKVAREALDS